ncbi:MAG: TlpA disulfide reductase family protein [Planctomycetota bacterium]
MRTTLQTWLAIFIATLASATLTSTGQQPDARSYFEKAAEKIGEVDTVTMRLRVSGSGSLGDAFMPAGEGTARLVRSDTPVGGLAFAAEVRGAGSETPKTIESNTVGMLLKPGLTSWIDHRKEALVSKAQTRTLVEDSVTLLNLLMVEQLVAETPFLRELNATGYEMLDAETVNGELCDVIKLTFEPKSDPRSNQQNPSTMGQEATWWFAQSDGLPRKIETVQNAQNILVLRFVQEVLDIDLDPEGLTLDTLSLDVPEGYDSIEIPTPGSRRIASGRDRQPATGAAPGGRPAPRIVPAPQPRRPVRQPVPEFRLATLDDAPVTDESIKGRVSVLYFWGTWCVPCRRISPLISELVEAFDGQPVDVYGVAVRERSMDAIDEYHNKQGYKHTVLVHPGSVRSDTVARAMKVRLYPTAYVIDAEGGIVGVTVPERDGTPESFAAQVENHIREAFDSAAAG